MECSNINKKCGVMEKEAQLDYIIGKLVASGCPLTVDIIPNSKNHGGATMLCIHEQQPDGVNIWHIEISKHGIFAYEFDDGVS